MILSLLQLPCDTVTGEPLQCEAAEGDGGAPGGNPGREAVHRPRRPGLHGPAQSTRPQT